MKYISNSPEETLDIAKQFAKKISGNEKLLLYGELGSGKTLFIKGIAAGLGMTNYNEVSSPSFVLIKEYHIKTKQDHSCHPNNFIKNNKTKLPKSTAPSRSEISSSSPVKKDIIILYHVDLYRIAEDDEYFYKEIDELIRNDDLVAIEWAEKLQETAYTHTKIHLEYVDETSRSITISQIFH